MATGKALNGKPYAGNPHVRFDEGEVAPAATPRRGSLLYKKMTMVAVCVALAVALTGCGKSAKDKSESRGREEKETENVGSPKRVAEDFVHALSDRDARKAERYVDTTQMSSKDIRDLEKFLEKACSEKVPPGFNFETIRESISVPASGYKLVNGVKYTGESAEVLIQFKRDRFKSRIGALIQLVKVDGSWKIDGSQKFGGNGGVWRKVGNLDESDGWDEDSVPAVDVETNKPAAYNSGEDSGGDTKIFTLPGGVRMEMVYVAPGSFQMGSENGGDDEKPVHKVTLTKGYWIGKYPVTQAQWNALVSAMDVSFGGEGRPVAWFSKNGGGSDIVSGMDTSDLPMENISWNDCKALVDALNKADREGLHWSLPTEAQWEFAARGGNKSRGYTYSGGNDLDAVGWYYENSGMSRLADSDWDPDKLKGNKNRPHSVKEKDIGNELGIVGMSGNVWEWCNDWYGSDYYSSSPTEDPQGPASGVYRVLRGGSWIDRARDCRSATRVWSDPGDRVSNFGFRLCCSAGPREAGAEQKTRRRGENRVDN